MKFLYLENLATKYDFKRSLRQLYHRTQNVDVTFLSFLICYLLINLRNSVLFVLTWVMWWHTCVSGVLLLVAWVSCLWRWCASAGGAGDTLGWVACHRLCKWRESVGGMSGVLTLVASYYYCYCYCWNIMLNKKIFNVYFWSKNEKIFQIHLSSDLKEEADLKSICCFTLFEPVTIS